MKPETPDNKEKQKESKQQPLEPKGVLPAATSVIPHNKMQGCIDGTLDLF